MKEKLTNIRAEAALLNSELDSMILSLDNQKIDVWVGTGVNEDANIQIEEVKGGQLFSSGYRVKLVRLSIYDKILILESVKPQTSKP